MYRTTVKIDGMACPMCEAHIAEAIRRGIPAASGVSASFKKKEAVFLSEEQPEEETVRGVVDATGYRYLSSESVPYVKKGLFGFLH
ncbi:heavy-metal-associated domain-containing protein [Lachnoclostridium sp. Marseille-P6806]|uniref:heavy-metal-associated domain-containing protein n=1 Tax=Lachnoclostridium sp. Marseille-P6806 TaxID=2364793 RepID=UPI001030E9AB|nr:heavy metal-associated domain-containing protein [Lachnoclostridium sp. Marseille-P6806]